MDQLSYKTKFVSKKAHEKSWYIIDVTGLPLGRACTKIASILRGKHKPSYTPHDDAGDYVIVVNSDKVHLTGNKWSDKVYTRYTGYPGGLRSATANELKNKNSRDLIEKAVKGMLPKNSLGSQLFRKLFVYNDGEHPHTAQNPETITIVKK